MKSCAASQAHGRKSRTVLPQRMPYCIRHKGALPLHSASMRMTIKTISCVSRSFSETLGACVMLLAGAPSKPSTAQSPLLMEVLGLTKTYNGQAALAEISFSVAPGEILGLIGPNGAGKTTLLEAIAGILPVDAGRVLWRTTLLPVSRRRELIFYLPDGLRPWDDQYVERLLGFFAAVYGRSEIDVEETVRAIGLAPVLDKRV